MIWIGSWQESIISPNSLGCLDPQTLGQGLSPLDWSAEESDVGYSTSCSGRTCERLYEKDDDPMGRLLHQASAAFAYPKDRFISAGRSVVL
jgi:hypothetical protein